MGKRIRHRRYYYRPLNGKELEQKYCSGKRKAKVYRFMDGYPRNIEKAVGYCWNDQHMGHLTCELMRRHDCLNKKCRFLQLHKKENTKNQNEKELEMK